MRRTMRLVLCGFLLVGLQEAVWAAAGGKPFQVQNRLRLEYDDNIYQTEDDKTDSLKVIEEVEFLVNFSLPKTFVSLRYRPAYVYWEEREPDNDDLHHEFDLVINQTFTKRLSLSVVDTLRRGEMPESEDGPTIVRERDDFYYNTLNGTLSALLRPATRLELGGRYVIMRYDDDDIAESEDFDLAVGGLTLRQQLIPETTLLAMLRAERIYYDDPDRGADSYYVGGGLEQIFTPKLLGSLNAGYQYKTFNEDDIDAASSPFGDIAVTFLPTPKVRLTAGAGYSLYESDAYPFANQRRTQTFAGLAVDITRRVAFYLSGGYTRGDYDADESVRDETIAENNGVVVKSGTEDVFLASTRLTLQLGRRNWLEAGWQYQNLDSGLRYAVDDGRGHREDDKLRMSYDRNRIDVGWKILF